MTPPSRNFLAFLTGKWAGTNAPNHEWIPHGMNAGGPKVVSDQYRLSWPDGRHGRCGDPQSLAQKQYDTPDPKYNPPEYKLGQDVDFHVLFPENHWGRFSILLCPEDFRSQENDCIALRRVNMATKNLVSPETIYFYPPPAKDDVEFVYKGSRKPGKDQTPQWTDPSFGFYWAQVNGFMNEPVYQVRYRLPRSLPWYGKKGTIALWYWVSSNTCNPGPCLPEDWKYKITSNGRHCADRAACGSNPRAYPEEFWNCIDVRIAGSVTGNNGANNGSTNRNRNSATKNRSGNSSSTSRGKKGKTKKPKKPAPKIKITRRKKTSKSKAYRPRKLRTKKAG